MIKKALGLFISVHCLFVFMVPAQSNGAAALVRSFYSFEDKADQVFNRRNLDLRRKWISPELYGLFLDELRKQDQHLKSHPDDKPLFGDGFPFSPLNEQCEANGRSVRRRYLVVQDLPPAEGRAKVTVKFSYPRPCAVAPVSYTAITVRSRNRWLIDDIIFDDGTRLSEAMRNHRY